MKRIKTTGKINIFLENNQYECTSMNCKTCKNLERCNLILPYDKELETYQDKVSYYKIKTQDTKDFKNSQLRYIDSKEQQNQYITQKTQTPSEIQTTKTRKNQKLIHINNLGYILIEEEKIELIQDSIITPEQLINIKDETYQKLDEKLNSETETTLNSLKTITKEELEELKETLEEYEKYQIRKTIKIAKENVKKADKEYRENKKELEKYEKLERERKTKIRNKRIKAIKGE